MRVWKLAWALSLVGLWTGPGLAGDLSIRSLDPGGRLTFSAVSSAQVYRVEWRTNLLSGQWSTNAPGLNAVPPSGSGTVSCAVTPGAGACFYRVVATTTNGAATGAGDFLVIDLSGGPAATNNPVTVLTQTPVGGWTDEYKTTKLVLRRVPAGTFFMGSPESELGRYSREERHQVTLSQGFYIGVFEVTQRQWERVMGTWPSWFTNVSARETRPVEQVSYDAIRGAVAGAGWPANADVDADSFLGRLRARTGRAFDLPTEAQWEHAARAGTTAALHSGYDLTNTASDAHLAELGRYWSNGGLQYSKPGGASTGPAKVGSYLPNAWGLYDFHGNILEWCLDWYGPYAGTATDPKGVSPDTYRVARGGSWAIDAYGCRSAYRDFNFASSSLFASGFRVALPGAP